MLPKRYSVLLALLLLVYAGTLSSQYTIVSTNGWTATNAGISAAAVPGYFPVVSAPYCGAAPAAAPERH